MPPAASLVQSEVEKKVNEAESVSHIFLSLFCSRKWRKEEEQARGEGRLSRRRRWRRKEDGEEQEDMMEEQEEEMVKEKAGWRRENKMRCGKEEGEGVGGKEAEGGDDAIGVND